MSKLLFAASAQVSMPTDCALNAIETAYVNAVDGDGVVSVQVSNVNVDALEQLDTRRSRKAVACSSGRQCGVLCRYKYKADESLCGVGESTGKYQVSCHPF